MVAFKTNSSNLKVWSIEMPNAPYLNRYDFNSAIVHWQDPHPWYPAGKPGGDPRVLSARPV